jgi:CHAD domain-containing protein
MAYRIKCDEAVGDAFRRIARTQADAAIDDVETAATSADNADAIHDCRKRCKKLRGLIRLVRPVLDEATYDAANEAFRDAARGLSEMRDAQALLATFDDVVDESSDHDSSDGLDSVRAELARRAGAGPDGDGEESAFDMARDLLRAGRDQLDDADLDADGWKAVRGGLAKTYGRGRDALVVVRDDPEPDNFHELRKRAKYTWYHVRLLAPSAPSILEPLGKQFKHLADGLGDAHDLAVLSAQLDHDPDAFGGDKRVRDALDLLDHHRKQLEHSAASLAAQLYAEPPKRFARRLERYWDLWQSGEIAS